MEYNINESEVEVICIEKRILTGQEMAHWLREHYSTTKASIIKRLSKKIEKYASSLDKNPVTDSYETLLTSMLVGFLKLIEKSILFDTLPDEWVYSFDLSYDEFSLNIEHVSQVVLDQDGDYRSHTTNATYKLITIHPGSVSIEKYCQLYNAEQGTVRQWIRRGKIRTASKVGNEWKIPLLTPIPSRGYEPAQYRWPSALDPDSLPEEYQYLSNYVLATFYQDSKEKSKYHVLFVSKETFTSDKINNNMELLLDAKEREKLELFMISHPQIKYCGVII